MNQQLMSVAGIMAEAVDTGLFVSLATFQQPSGNLNSSGAPDGSYTDVSGLVNIPCMAAPFSISSIVATEAKALPQILADDTTHMLLNGYYPALETGWRQGWRVVVDGSAHDLRGVESDSQKQMTRVKYGTPSI